MKVQALFAKASSAAMRSRSDRRSYAVGAVAIRADGVIVSSRNEAARSREPSAHAERRVIRKAGRGAVVYVVRLRHDGTRGLARPCAPCVAAMVARGVRRCYWSIDDKTFGVYVFSGA